MESEGVFQQNRNPHSFSTTRGRRGSHLSHFRRGSLWTPPTSRWRRKWQPTPVFLPGDSYGQRSLASYSQWGHRESDTTE